MKTKWFLTSALLVVLVLFIAGCSKSDTMVQTPVAPEQAPTPEPVASEPQQETPAAQPPVLKTETPSGPVNPVVEITTDGFNPKTITITAGDSVTWINKDSRQHWPASAAHPTHTIYPGSGLSKCSNPTERTTIFDACIGISSGKEFTFTFTEQGSWKYHDHLNPGMFGTVVVE